MNPADTSSGIWVSELNARAEIRGAFARTQPVRFYDTTLRDGEQSVGVVLDPQQKLEIARALDGLGVNRIEGGFPRVSSEDAESIRLLLGAKLRAEIWGFSRAVAADVDELVRLGVRCTIIEAPTSDIKLRAYSLTRDAVLQRIEAALRHARQRGITVAFFAVDATRTELTFLRKVYETALAAGAAEIVVVDTIGACGPEAVELLVREVRAWIGAGVSLHFHGHNDFGLATASAIAAVRGGADWIQGTINGMGERAGNADIGEIATALTCLYGVPMAIDLRRVREVSRLVAERSGYGVDAWKPVVGRNLFLRESGAVASQFHMPEAIEPFAASLVGAESERAVVLGKKSGLDSVAIKSRELGLNVSEEQRASVLAEVKRLGVSKRGLVSDAEFREIVARVCGAT